MGKFNKILDVITKDEVYKSLITILIGIIIYNLASMFLGKIITGGKTDFDRKRRKTIVDLFKYIFKYIIILAIILFVLSLYGYNVKTLVAGLGIAATVLGLALQDTIKDFICGITIILENYYVTGDIVRYKDFTGEVKEVTLKSTKIKAYSGEMLIVANRNISEIVNLSQKEADIHISIPISYEVDIEEAEKIITKKIIPACMEIKDVDSSKVKYLGVDNYGESSVSYLISIPCKQDNRWQIRRDVLTTILKIMKKNGISVPYNKVEVINAKSQTKR